MNPQPIILAVDAACTASQPSGVGLAQRRGDWYSGGEPDIPRLLDAAQRLAGAAAGSGHAGYPCGEKTLHRNAPQGVRGADTGASSANCREESFRTLKRYGDAQDAPECARTGWRRAPGRPNVVTGRQAHSHLVPQGRRARWWSGIAGGWNRFRLRTELDLPVRA